MIAHRKLALLAIVLLVGVAGDLLVFLGVGRERQAIDGIWRSKLFNSCLCDSYNFFVFDGGTIIQYSDQHLTDPNAGTYEDIGHGRYRVTINSDTGPPYRWVVRPGADAWRHTPMRYRDWFTPEAHTFYRPKPGHREQSIIAGSAQRDILIKAAIARKKANKSALNNPLPDPTKDDIGNYNLQH
jgi:hypothetical protein